MSTKKLQIVTPIVTSVNGETGDITINTTVDSAISATSTNPVQNKVIKTELDKKLPLSGGTLTGNLTGKYITGAWLQTTAATELTSAATKIPVLDSQGWVYYRTLEHLKSDLGVESAGAAVTLKTWMASDMT